MVDETKVQNLLKKYNNDILLRIYSGTPSPLFAPPEKVWVKTNWKISIVFYGGQGYIHIQLYKKIKSETQKQIWHTIVSVLATEKPERKLTELHYLH